ncbi:MAG: hypothetical protein ACYSYV_04810 [Planctomycetota bacterium]
MSQQELCRECNERHNCQEVYQQLGNTKGPSVVTKVVFAFLAPLVVFIASLAVFERMLAGVIEAEQGQIALSFLLALLATFACILIIRAANRPFRQDR